MLFRSGQTIGLEALAEPAQVGLLSGRCRCRALLLAGEERYSSAAALRRNLCGVDGLPRDLSVEKIDAITALTLGGIQRVIGGADQVLDVRMRPRAPRRYAKTTGDQ